MKYIIGIDGGGTKTLGYISDLEGVILGKEVGGPSNYHSVGIERTKDSILNVIKRLLSFVNSSRSDLELLVLGLAGVDRDSDKKIILDMLIDSGFRNEIVIKSDAFVSLVGAHGGKYGVITISGTGSICYGIDKLGKIVRCGGWGHIIDDEGSGYDVGRKALREIFRSYDGRVQKTILSEKIIGYLKLNTLDEIIRYIYNKETTKEEIAKIAPLVLGAASEGDKAAINILDEGINSLIEITETVIKNLEFNESVINLAIDGGILRENVYVKEGFIRKIKNRFNNINIYPPIFDGGIGALLIGWDYLNIKYCIGNIKAKVNI